MNFEAKLSGKLASRQAKVGVVGLGYVGLPLAVEFAKAGFTVTGIDVSQSKVDEVIAGNRTFRIFPPARCVLLSRPAKSALPQISVSFRNWTLSISAYQRRYAKPKTRT